MSLPITAPADYIGYLAVSKNQFKEDKFEEYITKFEKYYLKCVLSDQAYIDVRDQSSLDQKYLDLINGVDWVDVSDNDKNKVLTGFKTMLLHFIYYHYVADNWQHTVTGTTQNYNENSKRLPDISNKQAVYNRYNYGVDLYYSELIPFITEFKKITEDITGFIDNGGGSYTIQTASTKYLVDGDAITYNNTKYTVSNLVANVSFDINTGVAGQTISGKYYHEPYYQYNLPTIGRSWL